MWQIQVLFLSTSWDFFPQNIFNSWLAESADLKSLHVERRGRLCCLFFWKRKMNYQFFKFSNSFNSGIEIKKQICVVTFFLFTAYLISILTFLLLKGLVFIKLTTVMKFCNVWQFLYRKPTLPSGFLWYCIWRMTPAWALNEDVKLFYMLNDGGLAKWCNG